MNKRKSSLIIFVLVLPILFLGGCGIFSKGNFTKPEYIKEVIVRKEKFNDIIDNFLDQVETYDNTASSKDRLNNIATEAKNYIKDIKENLGPIVPDDCKTHYDNMMAAYNLYEEGIDLYLNNLPKPLGVERNNGIKSADAKFSEAKNAMMSL